jgi:hypothetical protein
LDGFEPFGFSSWSSISSFICLSLQSAVAPPLLCNLAKLANDPAPFVGAEGNAEWDKDKPPRT